MILRSKKRKRKLSKDEKIYIIFWRSLAHRSTDIQRFTPIRSVSPAKPLQMFYSSTDFKNHSPVQVVDILQVDEEVMRNPVRFSELSQKNAKLFQKAWFRDHENPISENVKDDIYLCKICGEPVEEKDQQPYTYHSQCDYSVHSWCYQELANSRD